MAEPEPDPRDQGPVDRALVQRALRGSAEDVEALTQRLRCVPRILFARNARAGRPLGREDLADLAQEVFATLWRKLGEFRGEAPLEAWVYPFCELSFQNHARKHVRRTAAMETTDLDQSRPAPRDAEPLASLDTARIHAALVELAADERAVIELKHFEELTFEAIAARLSISPNTAKTRYYRGLVRLERKLGPQFPPGDRP